MSSDRAIEELRAYAAGLRAAAECEPDLQMPLGFFSGVQRHPRKSWWLRPRLAVATAIFMVLNVGLAAASDSAVPGDVLYPLDLGYEAVAGLIGVDLGGEDERLSESFVLIARGDAGGAVRTASAAVGSADSESVAVLDDLATDLETVTPSPRSRADLHGAVEDLIETVQPAARSRNDDGSGIDPTSIQERARVVAETARGVPFEPSRGPGKTETENNGQGNGPDQNNGQGNGPDQNNGQGNGPDQNNGQGNGPDQNNGQGRGRP
jgi:hypothetical protein